MVGKNSSSSYVVAIQYFQTHLCLQLHMAIIQIPFHLPLMITSLCQLFYYVKCLKIEVKYSKLLNLCERYIIPLFGGKNLLIVSPRQFMTSSFQGHARAIYDNFFLSRSKIQVKIYGREKTKKVRMNGYFLIVF